MRYDYLKYYKSGVLVFLIGVLLFIVLASKDYWGLSISVFGAVSTLLFLITKYLWKYRPFIWMFRIDDFSGRYEGVLSYRYRDEKGVLVTGELKHIKLINQDGSRITVSSFTLRPDGTKSSLSVSKGMFVEKTEDEQHYRLIYNYLNNGSLEQGFSQHYGTEVVKFIKTDKKKILCGGYYTEREPFQTKGEFKNLEWVSDDLNHEF